MKIWTSTEKGNERIIAYIDQKIYRVNPKLVNIDSAISDLKARVLPTANYFEIELHELVQINLQDGKQYIEILFGRGSYEHFRVRDLNVRNEIFAYFKTNIPGLVYSEDRYSKFKAGKKPLIATAVVTALFLWSLYISNGIEKGLEYDVTGGHYNSFAGIVLAIASLGTKMVIMIFGSLLAIALFAVVKKMSNPPIIQRLTKIRR